MSNDTDTKLAIVISEKKLEDMWFCVKNHAKGRYEKGNMDTLEDEINFASGVLATLDGLGIYHVVPPGFFIDIIRGDSPFGIKRLPKGEDYE